MMRKRLWVVGVSSLLGAACLKDARLGPLLPPCAASAHAETLAVAEYLAIDPAATSGCVTFAANPSAVDSIEYLFVPQSAAGTYEESAPFQLQTAALPAPAPAVQPVTPSVSPGLTAVQFDGFLRQLARTRSFGAAAPVRSPTAQGAPTPPIVGSLRTFRVCGDLTCSSSLFQSVTAKATTVGAHIAIYVDTLAPKPALTAADLDTVTQLFDSRLYQLDTATFGGVSDIDQNSVVIVLMTNVVNKLVDNTTCQSKGFITGFFFSPDLELSASPSISNHGEVFYSIVADSAGTLSCPHSRATVKRLLPGTFVHEFQHMINYVQHVLVRGGQPEEGWLDEGLSKYAEELAGRSYLPGDTLTFLQYVSSNLFNVQRYLTATGDSPLLIRFDQGTLAEVGASWLFVRYIVDQYGDSLPAKLDQTTLSGAVNVATQTGQAFTTVVTQWALANWVSDLPGFATPPVLKYTSWHFRSEYGIYPLVPTMSADSAVDVSGWLRSGSGMYHRVFQGPSAPAFTLSFRSSPRAFLPPAVVARLNVIRIR